MNEYYQPQPRRTRRENPKETRVDLPHFYGKKNVETYLDWEMKVEQLFACHHVSEERKVPLATLSFQGNVIVLTDPVTDLRHRTSVLGNGRGPCKVGPRVMLS